MKVSQFLLNALTRREQPDNEELFQHLAQVEDTNHCLVAMREVLARHLLSNAATAGSILSEDTMKLRACERMEFARMFLAEFEALREQAKEQEKQKAESGRK